MIRHIHVIYLQYYQYNTSFSQTNEMAETDTTQQNTYNIFIISYSN